MKRTYVKYILALVLFGSNGIVASAIALTSTEIVFYRTLIGSLFLIGVFALRRQRPTFWQVKRDFLFLAASGIAMGLSWVLLFEAYRLVGVSVATLAYYCGPVFVMLLSPFVFKERLTAPKIAGFLAVALGMVLVNGAGVAQSGLSAGLVYGVLAAGMYAVMVICNKKAKSITGLENAMCQLAITCVVVAVIVLVSGGPSLVIPRASIAPLLFIGVVNTGIGCYFYFSAIPRLSAQTVSICGYLEPLSALLLSALLLGERLRGPQIVGAALILGGAAVGELVKARPKPESSTE